MAKRPKKWNKKLLISSVLGKGLRRESLESLETSIRNELLSGTYRTFDRKGLQPLTLPNSNSIWARQTGITTHLRHSTIEAPRTKSRMRLHAQTDQRPYRK